ncbi:MAG: exodeoxyribonuclease VII large subunit [Anaerolineales bacterium]|nr:exodeoxyribonuclease VII large subunit [Anaerolineales bacterium]
MAEAWSVSELNRYVRQSLEKDFRLQGVRVTGEVSGFRAYPSGHWYFTLKDEAAQVSCVLWRNRAEKLGFTPRDGDAVEAQGNVTLYETRGQYQLDVAGLQRAGEGELYREFTRLKARLEAEGLFAPERKRPLPAWPRTIGLVTSPAGAALRDMLNVIRRRFPMAEVLLSPTPVQGDDAPPQIVAALHALADARPDVIIVARGGGSLEDLWAFNDERVARAMAALPVPVVSGVGHETDFTIADFVADVRAPTPSAAAELVTPSRDQLRNQVNALAAQMAGALSSAIRDKRLSLREQSAQLKALSPQARLANARQRADDLLARAAVAMTHRLALERERWNGLAQALNGVSPLAVLSRGYAVVSHPDGKVVRKASEVKSGDPLRVRVSEGEFGVEVQDSNPKSQIPKSKGKRR